MTTDFSYHDQYFVDRGNQTRHDTIAQYLTLHHLTYQELIDDLKRSEYLETSRKENGGGRDGSGCDGSGDGGSSTAAATLYRILGMCHLKIQPPREDVAREYFHQSGTPVANFYLGGLEYEKFCCDNGVSCDAEITKKNVELVMAHRGRVVSLDALERAVEFFKTCVDVDHTEPDGFGNNACQNIFLTTQIKRWCGVAMSPEESQFGFECLQKAAEFSHTSQAVLFKCFLYGYGCDPNIRRALECLQIFLSSSLDETTRAMVPVLFLALDRGDISEKNLEEMMMGFFNEIE